MNAVITNWRTSAAGTLLILLGIAGIAGVQIAGFAMEPGAAISMGLGLLFAKDAPLGNAGVPAGAAGTK